MGKMTLTQAGTSETSFLVDVGCQIYPDGHSFYTVCVLSSGCFMINRRVKFDISHHCLKHFLRDLLAFCLHFLFVQNAYLS